MYVDIFRDASRSKVRPGPEYSCRLPNPKVRLPLLSVLPGPPPRISLHFPLLYQLSVRPRMEGRHCIPLNVLSQRGWELSTKIRFASRLLELPGTTSPQDDLDALRIDLTRPSASDPCPIRGTVHTDIRSPSPRGSPSAEIHFTFRHLGLGRRNILRLPMRRVVWSRATGSSLLSSDTRFNLILPFRVCQPVLDYFCVQMRWRCVGPNISPPGLR